MKNVARLQAFFCALVASVALSILTPGCEPPQEDQLAGNGAADVVTGSELPGTGFMYEEVVADDSWPSPMLALLEATAACPQDDVEGAPVPGWQPVLVSTGGCTQWIPPDWLILGEADQMFFASTQSQNAAAFSINLKLAYGVYTLQELADMTLAELGVRYGTDKPEVLVYMEYLDDSIPAADLIYSFDNLGTPLVGYLRVLYPGCSEQSQQCFAWLAGYWMPEANISTYACAMVQVDSSLNCPGK